jgi:protein phosphatase 2C family protein 2/3
MDTFKVYNEKSLNDHYLCTVTMKGKRLNMEDYIASYNSNNGLYLGVYDGHGGNKASKYVSENLHQFIDNSIPTLSVEDAIVKGFEDIEKELKKSYEEDKKHDPGTTAVIAIIKEKYIHIGNVGDSPAIISNNGYAKQVSLNHNTNNTLECKRATKSGTGLIAYDDGIVNSNGVELKVTRALGDFEFKAEKLEPKDQGVSPIPYIFSIDVRKVSDCIILYSDGISDIMNPQNVVSYIFFQISIGKTIKESCELLLDYCYCFNDVIGDDNMSLIILFFCGNTESKVIEYITSLYNSNNMSKWIDKKVNVIYERNVDNSDDFADCILNDIEL